MALDHIPTFETDRCTECGATGEVIDDPPTEYYHTWRCPMCDKVWNEPESVPGW